MSSKPDLKALLEELAQERGVDLRGYKPSTLERRIRRRMQQLGLETYSSYQKVVSDRPDEASHLLNAVLINVTRFFRDAPAWDFLKSDVLPGLISAHDRDRPFRAWCVGCSTGEEAYSTAMIIAECLESESRSLDVKIYATDNDESALNLARRAEYPEASMRGVPEEYAKKYFQAGHGKSRVDRDLRRLVIFGRSNIVSDAPISHVKLLICRNVLIYFDGPTQRQVMARFRYALDGSGIMFLGKAESQLRNDPYFVPLNSRWRIFQRTELDALRLGRLETRNSNKIGSVNPPTDMASNSAQAEELELLRLHHHSLLETLVPGVLVLGADDRILNENHSVAKLWNMGEAKLKGKMLADTLLWPQCPELRRAIEELQSLKQPSSPIRSSPIRFECAGPDNLIVAMTVKPIMESGRGLVGTLLYMEDVTPRSMLQKTIEELESTAEELQSSNEELETTNEELQSTNEELETTNEELQSTNEELETTNEELQSLNEELETINEELVSKTKELDEVNSRYSEMIERMPWPVLLVDEDLSIYLFNSSAQSMFGFATPSDKGMRLEQLPLPGQIRTFLIRRHGDVLRFHKTQIVRNKAIQGNRFSAVFDIYFIPLAEASTKHGVLMMFESLRDPRPTITQKFSSKLELNGKKNDGKGAKAQASNGAKSQVRSPNPGSKTNAKPAQKTLSTKTNAKLKAKTTGKAKAKAKNNGKN